MSEARPPNSEAPRPRILVVDDEDEIRRVFSMVLEPEGYEVETAGDGLTAADLFRERPFDAVLTDLTMPGLDGVDLLRAIRQVDLDVPVVIITAAPSLESAIRAVEYGALRYIVKPVRRADLLKVVQEAVRLHQIARLKREALQLVGAAGRQVGDAAGLEVAFARAVVSLFMVYQPIISWPDRKVYGYEALVRSKEGRLPDPGALFDAAERLDRLEQLGRAIRHAAQAPFDGDGEMPYLFVNLHPADLHDDQLLSPDTPLAAIADRVVLEITERMSLDHIHGIHERIAQLRRIGYRIAIDDLGAGYAGLTSFSLLEPEVVKLDQALVQGVDASPTKQKVIRSFCSLCHEMDIKVVAEGIEHEAERDVLLDLGCDLLQGFLFARPGPAFPGVAW